jgi:ABC-type glycerol-3-phosphate transport system substrate-binding protein
MWHARAPRSWWSGIRVRASALALLLAACAAPASAPSSALVEPHGLEVTLWLPPVPPGIAARATSRAADEQDPASR